MNKGNYKPNVLRIIGGLILMVLGFISPLLSPMVWELEISSTWKSLITGGLVFGIPEVLMLIAIAIMGKETWGWIKMKASQYVSFISPQKVSRSRYYCGVILFSITILEGIIQLHSSFIQDFLGDNLTTYQWVMNGLFLLSIIIAGGEFWDKMRSLFIHESTVVFGTKKD